MVRELGSLNELPNIAVYSSIDSTTKPAEIERARAVGLAPAVVVDDTAALTQYNTRAEVKLFPCPGRCEPWGFKCWASVPVGFITHGQLAVKNVKLRRFIQESAGCGASS